MSTRLARFCGLVCVATFALSGPLLAKEAQSGGVRLPANAAMNGNMLGSAFAAMASQQPHPGQPGSGLFGGGPMVSTNTAIDNNIAAGLANTAGQRTNLGQSSPLVTLDLSGRGPMVTTNVAVGTNVGAGIGNWAAQGLQAGRR